MANGPLPVNWATNNAPLSVLLEADLAGLRTDTFQSGTLCTVNLPGSGIAPTAWIWAQGSTAGTVLGVSVAATGGAWLAFEIGAIGAGVVNTVVGAAGTLSLQRIVPIGASAVTVHGYTTPGDGGGGAFYWDGFNVAADDGGTIIRPVGVIVGAWVRIDALNRPTDPRFFGAKVDTTGVADAVVTNASNILSSATAGFKSSDVGKLISVHIPSNAATGTVTTVATSRAVVGVGTLFTVEFAVGAPIVIAGIEYQVAVITNNTHIRVHPIPASSAGGLTAFRAARLITTIAGIASSTQITLGALAPNSGNGITIQYGTNDTAAIQAAWDFSDYVLVSKGTSAINAKLTTHQGQRIEGFGTIGGSTIVNFGNDHAIFGFGPTASRNLILQGFQITDAFGPDRTAGDAIHLDANGGAVTYGIYDIQVSGHLKGLYLREAFMSGLHNLRLQGCYANAWHFDGGTGGLFLLNCDNLYGSSCFGEGLVNGPSRLLNLRTCANELSPDNGIRITDGPGAAACYFCTLTEPDIESVDGNGIVLETSGYEIVVNNAQITRTGVSGLVVKGECNRVRISGESFLPNRLGAGGVDLDVTGSGTDVQLNDIGFNTGGGITDPLSILSYKTTSTYLAKTLQAVSQVTTPIVDSGTTVDLELRRNGAYRIRATATGASVNGPVVCTAVDSGAAADLPLARNGLTKITVTSTGATIVGSASPDTNTFAFSGTPTFDGAVTQSFKTTLTANITSATFVNLKSGAFYTFVWVQDIPGAHTVALGTDPFDAGLVPTTVGAGTQVTTVWNCFFDGRFLYLLTNTSGY